jgi:hypothetical protein
LIFHILFGIHYSVVTIASGYIDYWTAIGQAIESFQNMWYPTNMLNFKTKQ